MLNGFCVEDTLPKNDWGIECWAPYLYVSAEVWCNWFIRRRADQSGYVLWADAEEVLARVVRGGGGHVLRWRKREQQQHSRWSAGLRPLLQDWHAGRQWWQQPLRGTLAHSHPWLRPFPLWLRHGHRVWKWHSAKRGVYAGSGGLTEQQEGQQSSV